MQYRTLGRWGVKVSTIGLGSWLTFGGSVEEGRSEEVVGAALQLALAWVLAHQAVSSAIVGATKTDHVDDNVAAGDLDLDAGLLATVDEVLAPVAAT